MFILVLLDLFVLFILYYHLSKMDTFTFIVTAVSSILSFIGFALIIMKTQKQMQNH